MVEQEEVVEIENINFSEGGSNHEAEFSWLEKVIKIENSNPSNEGSDFEPEFLWLLAPCPLGVSLHSKTNLVISPSGSVARSASNRRKEYEETLSTQRPNRLERRGRIAVYFIYNFMIQSSKKGS